MSLGSSEGVGSMLRSGCRSVGRLLARPLGKLRRGHGRTYVGPGTGSLLVASSLLGGCAAFCHKELTRLRVRRVDRFIGDSSNPIVYLSETAR